MIDTPDRTFRTSTGDSGGRADRTWDTLRPYVANLAVARQHAEGSERLALISGTMAFVDVSGFTRLTEALAGKGKAGAEELSELLDVVFAGLLSLSDDLGGELIKWGGDAVLLFYTGDGHAERAAAASVEMQARMRHLGRLRTSCGPCTLRISVGVHSGAFHFLVLGRRHRELLVAGPGATTTATMEGIAEAGEIVVSSSTAELLPPGWTAGPKDAGWLIDGGHRYEPPGFQLAEPAVDLSPLPCVPEKLRAHLLAGPVVSEHRQVAVAFIEYMGTDAALAGGDPSVVDDLDQLVSLVQDCCAAHDVAFWETDISKDGGKIMLVAGAPAGTDDDGGRLLAVLHDTMGPATRLTLRAGATYGRVFTGEFGPPNRRTYTVKGDNVNLAARLMARAGAGEIYASENLLRRTRVEFAAEPLEPFLVKGKLEPIRARRLLPGGGHAGAPLAAAPAAAVAAATVPFVGRAHELAALLERLHETARGHGACIELSGSAGIGKTRLIDEVVARAPDHDVLRVRCDHYRSHRPYAAARELGRQALGVDRDADPGLAGEVLIGAVTSSAPELEPWLPLLADAIGAEVPPTPESAALDTFRPARLREAYGRFLRAVLTRPTVIIVDNVHEIDEASAGVLEQVSSVAPTAPWLVVFLGRPGGGPLAIDEHDRRERIDLDALAPEEARRLLRAATAAHPLGHRRTAAIVERGEGNPLFLLELAGLAHEIGEDSLPDSVESVFAARLDELPPPDRYLLRVASVLGRSVAIPVLAAMVEGDVSVERFAALGAFIAEDGVGSLRFRNKMLQDAAYEGLAFSQRARLHGLAATALEQLAGDRPPEIADLLAFHFGRAGTHDKAWRYARIAADRARGLHAHADAARLYEQTLEAGRRLRGVGHHDLFLVAEAIGDSYSRAGEFVRADAAYRAARRWASDGAERTQLNYKVASVAERCGSYARALRMLTLAERSAAQAPPPDAERVAAKLWTLRGLIRHRQGRGSEAVRMLRAAVEHARAAGAPDLMAEALVHLDDAELTVGEPGGGEHAREALSCLQAAGGHLWLEAQAYNQLGIRAYFAGRWPEAVEHYRACGDAMSRSGDEWAAAVAAGNIAEVLSDQGHLAEAREILEEMLPAYRAAGTPSFVAYGNLLWGRLAARSGRFEEAWPALAEAEQLYRAEKEMLAVAHSRALVAEAQLLAGDHASARATAEGCLAELERLDGGNLLAPLALRVAGVAAFVHGDDEARARERLERSIAVARSRRAQYELALSLQARADLWPDGDSAVEREECRVLCEQLGLDEGARHLVALAPAGG